MEAGQDLSPKKLAAPPSLQERTLVYGMLQDKGDTVTDYRFGPGGVRTLSTPDVDTDSFSNLVDKFRKDPTNCLVVGRDNLFSIMQDPRLPHAERLDRLSRYLNAYFDLQIKLDHQAFPPSEKVLKGIPDYIPDGLSDMGSDPSINPGLRGREKIRVDKQKIFKQSKDLFMEIFSHDYSYFPPELRNHAIELFTAKKIAHYVYTKMPYDDKDEASPDMGKSVALSHFRDRQLAVCRQQALYTQVLLQASGLTAKLVKTDMSSNGDSFEPHVNNLVRLNKIWNVLDTTNPDRLSKTESVVFILPIKETDINLNGNVYTWSFSGYETRKYRTRSNMFYRIRDNVKNPA